ncbi:MAG: hypothetical protein H6505_05870, partial [Calditrichaeota bacterium]|nr:hypothetical protein [Calditrichota bacterium]
MKYLSLAVLALAMGLCSLGFAEEESSMANVTGTAKIAKAPALETKPAMLAATAYVK